MFILVLPGEARGCSVLITDGNKLCTVTEKLKQKQEHTTVLLLLSNSMESKMLFVLLRNRVNFIWKEVP